jgi:paraquat-inducible protein A
MEDAGRAPGALTAAAAGLVGCTECGRPNAAGARRCGLCGSRLAPPSAASLQAVWAWLLAGLIAYVPANLYPMLETTLFGRTSVNTIVGGIGDLARHGNYGVAAIVFVASVVIPTGKFIAIAWLCLAVQGLGGSRHLRQRLYEVVEFIGRWSMVDVFVVGVAVALVKVADLARITLGPAFWALCALVLVNVLYDTLMCRFTVWQTLERRRAS